MFKTERGPNILLRLCIYNNLACLILGSCIIRASMLRVLSGRLKGRAISTLGGSNVTRPPLSRIRKAVIDTLRPHLGGAAALDVFGGSGSYSFEAISNGAGSATIIELSPAALKVIKANVKELGVSGEIELLQGDAFKVLPRLGARGSKFDVVFVAPPQGKGMVEKTLAALISSGTLAEGAIVACQFATREANLLEGSGLTELKRKVHGGTELAFLEFFS